MKTMTTKELTLLGKDLNNAKILVLHKHGFSCEEIAIVCGVPESIVRALIDSYMNRNNG